MINRGEPFTSIIVNEYQWEFIFIGVPVGGLGGAKFCSTPPDSGRNLEKFGQLSRKIRAQKDEENPQILPQILP